MRDTYTYTYDTESIDTDLLERDAIRLDTIDEQIEADEVDFWHAVDIFRERLLRRALEKFEGHQDRAANYLGLGRATVSRMVSEYGLKYQYRE